ncbi:hypothetical protein ACVIWV_005424 [Bradyrhizobium diazoefficiens]
MVQKGHDQTYLGQVPSDASGLIVLIVLPSCGRNFIIGTLTRGQLLR